MSGEDGPVIASGPPTQSQPDGSVPLRIEIGDLSQNTQLWTLYLLGLKAFEQMDTEKPMSYYQIAGIHGAPHIKWPDRDWNNMEQNPDSTFGGFCTHDSILFLPWHRPYLALFEQALYSHVSDAAQSLAQELNDNSWVTAAQSFRMPYWDWADPTRGTYPPEVLSPTVSIIQPGSGGSKKDMPNPLYDFVFKDKQQAGNVRAAGVTWRIAPTGNVQNNEQKMINAFKSAFERQKPTEGNKNLTERVLLILQSYYRYGPFSNDRFVGTGSPGTYGSAEDIHNTIHNVTGGGGQMTDPDVSAFDPIFWLHHTNIDRLFAIWQALHESDSDPDTFVQPETAGMGDWSTAAGDTEDENTELLPFWKTQTSFYKSTDVKQTSTFGYAYPETQSWQFSSTSDYQNDINARLVQLYPAASVANTVREASLASTPKDAPSIGILKQRAKTHIEAAAAHPVTLAAAASRDLPKATPPPAAPATNTAVHHTDRAVAATASASHHDRKLDDLVVNGKYLEWITNIRAKKHEFDRSFNVHVFLGPVPDVHAIQYSLQHGHVGTYSVFSREGTSGCGRCKEKRAANINVTGQIPLTVALAERYLAGQIRDLTPASVIPYLQQHLHWRVTYPHGEEIPRTQVEHVLVSVISNEATLSEDPNRPPRYAQEVVVYPEITTKADGQTARGDGTGLTDVGQA